MIVCYAAADQSMKAKPSRADFPYMPDLVFNQEKNESIQ